VPELLTEIKTTLSGRVDEFVCEVVERSPEHAIVVYRIPGPGRNVHGVWLPPGTVTVGYFWKARPYNLYHWVDPNGRTRAHYFNVGDVRRYDADRLEWRDLAVDILATPDGRVVVLDEDELPADLDLALRRYIDAARDEVLRGLERLIRESEHTSAVVVERLSGGG
jgi:hypothetical protein